MEKKLYFVSADKLDVNHEELSDKQFIELADCQMSIEEFVTEFNYGFTPCENSYFCRLI